MNEIETKPHREPKEPELRVRLFGSRCEIGYRREVREAWPSPDELDAKGRHIALNKQITLVERKPGGEYIVPNDNVAAHYKIELLDEQAWMVSSGNLRKKCYPVFELANTRLNSAKTRLNSANECELDFVNKYGPSNGLVEIWLEEFRAVAGGFDRLFEKLTRGELKGVAIPLPPQKIAFDEDGTTWQEVKYLQNLCWVQFQALIDFRGEVRRCEQCHRWYASKRGTSRFCNYEDSSCRQKFYATRP